MAEVVLLGGADADVQDIDERAEERGEGRGDDAVARVEAALSRLAQFPEAGRPPFRTRDRRLVIPSDKLGIFHQSVGQRVLVAAILDLRQDPASILRRLGLR